VRGAAGCFRIYRVRCRLARSICLTRQMADSRLQFNTYAPHRGRPIQHSRIRPKRTTNSRSEYAPSTQADIDSRTERILDRKPKNQQLKQKNKKKNNTPTNKNPSVKLVNIRKTTKQQRYPEHTPKAKTTKSTPQKQKRRGGRVAAGFE